VQFPPLITTFGIMELAIIVVLDSCIFCIDVDSFDVDLGVLFHSIIYIYLMFLFLYGFFMTIASLCICASICEIAYNFKDL
jgi:hypothetical protein